MTKLNLSRKHFGTSADCPSDNGFANDAFLDSFDDAVFFDSTNLAKKDKHLAFRILFITEEVVDESRARITITANRNTFVGTVGDQRQDVVELIRHASRFGYVTNSTRAIKLGRDDIVHHTTVLVSGYDHEADVQHTLQSYRS